MARNKVLLAVQDQENRRLLADWLGDIYDVAGCDAFQDVAADVVLCIVDDGVLNRSETAIVHYKKSQYPKFAPVLLITQRDNMGRAARQLGKAIDDWMTAPIENELLQARIQGLIYTRSLTANLLRLQEGTKSMLKSLQDRQFAVDQHAIVAIADLKGRITYANDKFCAISGYSRQELLGRDHSLLNSGHHPKSFWRDMYRTLAAGRAWRAEVCNRAKDGGLYWVDTTIAPLMDNDDKLQEYFAIRTDMTDRKRIEIEAKNANATKSEFLANMSHEIRTPMNGMIGMLDILQQSGLSGEQNRMLGATRASALAMLQILNDILDFSKIEAGKMVVENIPTLVRDIVEGVAHIMMSTAADKGVELHTFVAPELPVWIMLDPLRLRQILFNLLGNALKFTSSSETRRGAVTLRVEPFARGDGAAGLQISVRDNGIGMSEQTVAALFRPFTQADETTTRRFGGTGLGLSITHRLAELLHGRISVRSTLGEGSEFCIELPLEKSAPGQPLAEELDLSGVSVMIATDNPVYEKIL
ncbi:MAG: ATP-binding protein, partial [Methylomonas sp.]